MIDTIGRIGSNGFRSSLLSCSVFSLFSRSSDQRPARHSDTLHAQRVQAVQFHPPPRSAVGGQRGAWADRSRGSRHAASATRDDGRDRKRLIKDTQTHPRYARSDKKISALRTEYLKAGLKTSKEATRARSFHSSRARQAPPFKFGARSRGSLRKTGGRASPKSSRLRTCAGPKGIDGLPKESRGPPRP